MTFTPEEDLAKHLRFIAEYEDGTTKIVCGAPGSAGRLIKVGQDWRGQKHFAHN